MKIEKKLTFKIGSWYFRKNFAVIRFFSENSNLKKCSWKYFEQFKLNRSSKYFEHDLIDTPT